MEDVQGRFPSYFDVFEMPPGAQPQRITVHRACGTGTIDRRSFLSTFEEQGCEYQEGDDPEDPGLYSLSTYERPKDVRRFMTLTSKYDSPFQIAVGCTEPLCGPCQRTRERTRRKTSHVDWWLYEGASPEDYFEMIEDFDEYCNTHNKEKRDSLS